MGKDALETIWTRRVTRAFTDQLVSKEDLETVVEAARWAPSAGNRRLQKFIVVENPRRIRQIRAISPGMSGYPSALVVICTDWQKAEREGLPLGHCNAYIDVGTAAENMLLAAHALELGTCPVASFSKEALKVLLDLPDWLSPDLVVCLGYPAKTPRSTRMIPAKPIHWQDLTYWERYDVDANGSTPSQVREEARDETK